jgi:hypothetical protein
MLASIHVTNLLGGDLPMCCVDFQVERVGWGILEKRGHRA